MADFDKNNEALNENDFRPLNKREKVLKYSAGLVPPHGKSTEQALEELKIKMKKISPVRAMNFKPWLIAAAAVVFIAILVYPVFLMDKKKIVVKNAENKEIILPDGTQVIINSGSHLTYSKRNYSKNRYIKLEGEAYLHVIKGNEFVISTSVGKVEVLGTELNIFSRGNTFKVSCISGKIGVSAGVYYNVLLPGEYAELTVNGLIKKSHENIENTVSWKHGEFYFEDQPLVTIFGEIERQFNISVKQEGLENRFFTGKFSNKNLKEALDIICIPMNLNYAFKEGNKVIIFNSK